jgi:hypothetical protein
MISKVTEHEQEILKLWQDGLTGSEIADYIGVTRNAVMGKLHRLRERNVITYKNIATRTAAIRHKVRVKERDKQIEKALNEPKIEEKPLAEAVEELLPLILEELRPKTNDHKPVKFMDLQSSSCRYVVSGVMAKDFLFCNEVKKIGSPYCQEHHSICNTPNLIIKKKAVKNDAAT